MLTPAHNSLSGVALGAPRPVGSVGTSVRRKEGPEKLCGSAKYIDDYDIPDCLHGATLRSTIAHGRIKSIRFDPDFPWKQYVVATAKDIPGKNRLALHVPMPEDDQPLLADELIQHPMEPILLVAHKSRQKAYEALRHISVDYEELKPVLDMRAATKVFKDILIEKGDLKTGFGRAEVVVEGEYRVGHQEQAYIENNGAAAYVEKDGTIVIMGSMQCPYYVQKGLKPVFPSRRLRVIQTTTGGGFGGKEEYPDLIGGHAALLALKAKRPVKIIYDRHEDMAATTKRHPAVIRHRTALSRGGKLLAQDIEVLMDGGAYVTLSPVVLSRGAIHAAGPYECPNVRIRAKSLATNTPPNGAFRGFGAPQTLFAAELHMERIAEALGVDGLTLRRLNVLKEGSSTATGQVLRESVGASEVLERCALQSRYVQKKRECAQWNRESARPSWRGIGLALVYHGVGFTGAGEVHLKSKAGVALTRTGQVRVLAASTEIGQGTTTMFAQIAADALGVPYDWIDVEVPDTAKVPNSGPTVASRTCTIVGGLVEKAAKELRAKLGRAPRTRAELKKAALRLCRGKRHLEFISEYEKPKEIHWDEKNYRGDAYGSFGYAACAVEVEVDKETYQVRIRDFHAAVELGKAVNPVLAQGQIIGGMAQAIGYALYEDAVFKNGFMQNSQLTNYILPTTLDTPDMQVHILEKPYSYGPQGAKGLGELPIDVPAPAIAAAVRNATGLWLTELPILPEKILKALNDRKAASSRLWDRSDNAGAGASFSKA